MIIIPEPTLTGFHTEKQRCEAANILFPATANRQTSFFRQHQF
jgi:hypothetical protein